MKIWPVYLVLLVALVWAKGYVAVLVDGGPEIVEMHIYALTPKGWEPVHVVYQPELIETYIVATGEKVTMPHYNLTRYLLLIPREAVATQRRPMPKTPPGLQLWSLEIDNGTAKVTVPLAVGKRPIDSENATQATWHSFGQQPAKTPNRGRIVKAHDQKRDPETVVAGHEVTITAEPATTIATGSTVYVIGGTYFNSIAVAGTFSTYMPVYSPTGKTHACLDNMFVIGFEAVNATVGVSVDGYIIGGYLTLEVYNLNTCSQISSITLALPQYGTSWTNVALPSVGPDVQLGLRIRVSGRAEAASIKVSAAIRYSKTVNSPAQVATSMAQSPFPNIGIRAGKNAVLFGPFIAYDGLIGGRVTVPSSTVRLTWYGSTCPYITVTYYVNFIAQSFRLVAPRTTTPSGWYCYYDVPATTLTIDRRAYTIAKAVSGGGLAVSIVYDTVAGGSISSSASSYLTITFNRWLEPLPSKYTDSRGLVNLVWTFILLYNTYEMLNPMNSTPTRIVSEIRATESQIWLTLSHNTQYICGAKWGITLPVSRPVLYYGNTVVEEPWWATIAKRVTDAIEWILSVGGKINQRLDAISLTPITNLFESATGSVRVAQSNGLYIITWTKGWSEAVPQFVTIRLEYTGALTSPTYVEWRTFTTGILRIDRPGCNWPSDHEVGTSMYLPPRDISGDDPVRFKMSIWTWRGQVHLKEFVPVK